MTIKPLTMIAGLALGAALTGCNAGEPARDAEGNITEQDTVAVGELRTGDCFNDPSLAGAGEETVDVTNVEVIPCDQKHQLEVYHDFALADGDYPGDDAVLEQADSGCLGAFQDFAGKSYNKSVLEVFYYFPQPATWEQGDRIVQCLVKDPKGEVSGSLAGANR